MKRIVTEEFPLGEISCGIGGINSKFFPVPSGNDNCRQPSLRLEDLLHCFPGEDNIILVQSICRLADDELVSIVVAVEEAIPNEF